MRFEFKSSFDRSVKSFHSREKEEIKKVAQQAIDIILGLAIGSNRIYAQATPNSVGIFL